MEFKIGYLGRKNQPCELLMITMTYWKRVTSLELLKPSLISMA